MSTAHVMASGAATGISATSVICSSEQKTERWLTPPCFTTVLPFVRHTFMATGKGKILTSASEQRIHFYLKQRFFGKYRMAPVPFLWNAMYLIAEIFLSFGACLNESSKRLSSESKWIPFPLVIQENCWILCRKNMHGTHLWNTGSNSIFFMYYFWVKNTYKV